MGSMKAIVCTEPGRLELVRRPVPEPVPGMVSVDIRAIGVCGTDFHIFKGLHPFLEYPRIMGHELSAIVAEGARTLGPGTPVIINPYLACGTCIACRKGKPNCCTTLKVLGVHVDGGMCERILVPEENLYPANGLSLRDAAMIEFLAIGAHAVRRAEIANDDKVLVVGAGPIGMATAIFAARPKRDVTFLDTSVARLATAQDILAACHTVEAGKDAAAEIAALTDDNGFDVVFDATGNAGAMERSFDYVASGGTLVMVGVLKAAITFDDPEFHRRELTIRATRNATREDFDTVIAAVAEGAIPMDRLNTHSAALDALPQAMPEWLAGEDRPLKAVLTV